MKTKILLMSILLISFLNGCNFWGVRGNGKLVFQNRNIEKFDRLEISGAYNVKIEVGKEPSIKINAEENLIPLIKTTVEGSTLIIESKKGLSPKKEIKILITTPSLNYVDISGANDVKIYNLDEDLFEVDLSGAGSLYLNGKSNKMIADLSGAGSINAKELKSKIVEISVSGAASADVFASESISASVSGVGSINYYGNPSKTNTNVSGVGSINKK